MSAPSRTPVNGAVITVATRMGTATMLRAIRAPWWRWNTKTPSTSDAAAQSPVTMSATRVADSTCAMLRPRLSPSGEERNSVTVSRVSTEWRLVIASKTDSSRMTDAAITNPPATISWRGRADGSLSLMGLIQATRSSAGVTRR